MPISARWKRAGARVLLTLAALLVSLLAVEGLLRLVTHKPQLRGGWWLGTEHRVLDDDAIVLSPRLREPAYYRHRDGVPSIVVLGDSFTEGYPYFGDDAHLAYVPQIAAALRSEGIDADVINVGQGETGTDQEIRIFEKYVLPNIKPTIVIWQLYTNDVHENYNYAAFALSDAGDSLVPLDGTKHWTHRRQRIYDWTPLPAAVKRWSYLFNAILHATESTPAIPERYAGDWEAWSVDKIRLGLARMQQHAKTYGFTLLPIVLVPGAVIAARTDPAWKTNGPYKWYQAIRAVLETAPTFVDTEFSADDLTRAAKQFGAGTIYLGDEDQAPEGDRHYNAAGHWLLAGKLVPRLRALLRPAPVAVPPSP